MMETTTNQKRSPRLSFAPEPTPWLVYPRGEGGKKLTFCNISDPKRNSYVRSFHEIREKVCMASMHGWLVMIDSRSSPQLVCFLWNPDTREIVHLPLLEEIDLEHSGFWILSSPPTDPECMVLYVRRTFFLIWRRGDEKWTKQDHLVTQVLAVIGCTNGNIYAYMGNGPVAVIERESCGILSVRLLDFEMPKSCRESVRGSSYLVESCGDIYLVCTHYVGSFNPIAVKHIEIFKMDLSKEVFLKVECLGDRIFFISHISHVSFSATKLGLKGNCVYFTLQNDNSLYVFDLEDESISVYLPCPNLLTSSFLPFWYMPSNRMNEIVENGDRETENIITEEELKRETTDTEVTIVNAQESEGRHWLDLLPLEILSSIPPIRLPTQYPLLMFSKRGNSVGTFFDPIKDIRYCWDMPKLLGAKICFSKDGWLLMCKSFCSMFFFNPFTNLTIQLPDLPYPDIFQGASFSTVPTSPDCIVFLISFALHNIVSITFLRLEDDHWTSLDVVHEVNFFPSENNPVFYNGAFYCLDVERYLGIFDPRDESWTILHTPRPCSSIHQNYLLECNGELISIFVGLKGKYVRAYKLDQSNMDWTTSSSLKDQMVFVSRSTSMSLKAIPERMKNRIYFPMSFTNNDEFLFYSLETQSWNSSSADYFQEDLYNIKERTHCSWVQPSLS